jgi:hypothetical protein
VESGSEISEKIAAQNQALQTKYAIKTLEAETNSKCRLYQPFDSRPHYISMFNTGKRTIRRKTS